MATSRLLIMLFSLGTRDYAAGRQECWGEYRGRWLFLLHIGLNIEQVSCTPLPLLLLLLLHRSIYARCTYPEPSWVGVVGKVQQYSRYLFQLVVGRWPLIVFQSVYLFTWDLHSICNTRQRTNERPIELHSRNENINPGWTIDNSSSCQCTCSLALSSKWELH